MDRENRAASKTVRRNATMMGVIPGALGLESGKRNVREPFVMKTDATAQVEGTALAT